MAEKKFSVGTLIGRLIGWVISACICAFILAGLLKVGDISSEMFNVLLTKVGISGLSYWTYFWGSMLLYMFVDTLFQITLIFRQLNSINESTHYSADSQKLKDFIKRW